MASYENGNIDDIHRISAVKARYCRLIDTKRWEDLRNLLTDDFVFDDAAKNLCLTDADDFVEFVRTRHARSISVHQGTMPDIVLNSADRAVGTWAMWDLVLIPQFDAVTTQRGCGYYHDKFRKEAGKWLLAEVRLSRLWLSVGNETPLPSYLETDDRTGTNQLDR